MLLCSCGEKASQSTPAGIAVRTLPKRTALEGPLFEELSAEQTGVDFVHQWSFPQGKYDLETALVWGGVCAGDYDGDSRPDIFLTRSTGGCRLYRNLGDFRFQDVTDAAGVATDGTWATSASFADVDDDGDLDLYVCCYDAPNRLYVNHGDGTFREQARSFGLDFDGASTAMAFCDYDLDGDLDGYLLTHSLKHRKETFKVVLDGNAIRIPEEHREHVGVLYPSDGRAIEIETGQLDRLYRNDGDGTFTDVAPKALPHTPWFSMGIGTADIDNDGRLDLMGSDMSGTSHYKQKVGMGDMSNESWFLSHGEPLQYMRNAVYLNTGTERFMEVAYLTGLASSDWTWSLLFGDLDEDGWADLFVSNGMTRDWVDSDLDDQADAMGGQYSPEGKRFWLEQPQRTEKNLAFRNLGDLRFREVGSEWGLDHFGVTFGAVLSDLDLDGDLDLVITDFEGPARLYRNGSAGAHRVQVRLRGRASNSHGLGATVRVRTAAGEQVRFLTGTRGFASAGESLAHFGLSRHSTVDRLTVEWPSGHVQHFDDLPGNRHYTVTEPEGPVSRPAPPDREPTMFEPSKAVRLFSHKEADYDDYARQPLLPQRMSRLGPGLACGDVDGDGDDDLYFGGAAGEPGDLVLNRGAGRFRWSQQGSFDKDAAHEDMGALFLDSDADGDMDLYVVSGGAECDPGSPLLRDRLYLNDGQGGFSSAPEGTLPDLADSGGPVAAADFDRDGYVDLFVGGRQIPGRYPLTPESRLLRNEGERFAEVTDANAPGLRRGGMITSALWSDADGDGWVDLLLTYEWGPVRFWRNDQGKLVDRTAEAGLGERPGWWNGIAGRDVDNDGDIDYAVTNFGLNTKYHAQTGKPTLLFCGDFESSGRMRLVEAGYEDDHLFPLRGKSCSSNAMPFLKDRFPTFKSFALASLNDIYAAPTLESAQRFEVDTLESGVLINDGRGRFDFRPLPRLAQVAPGFGVVLTEVDGDGDTDLYLVQNFFSPQPETGRMDGGMSLLLLGGGDGTFRPVGPDRSGLVVTGDAKGLACTDLNRDGWADFVATVNDNEPAMFLSRGRDDVRVLEVRLDGPVGNPTGVGARVTLTLDSGASQTAEVCAGGSYLSQSSPSLFFGLGKKGRVREINVRWPDGTVSATKPHVDNRNKATVSFSQTR